MDDTCSCWDRDFVITKWLVYHKITLVWCKMHWSTRVNSPYLISIFTTQAFHIQTMCTNDIIFAIYWYIQCVCNSSEITHWLVLHICSVKEWVHGFRDERRNLPWTHLKIIDVHHVIIIPFLGYIQNPHFLSLEDRWFQIGVVITDWANILWLRSSYHMIGADWRGHIKGPSNGRRWGRRQGMTVLEGWHGMLVIDLSCQCRLGKGRGGRWGRASTWCDVYGRRQGCGWDGWNPCREVDPV